METAQGYGGRKRKFGEAASEPLAQEMDDIGRGNIGDEIEGDQIGEEDQSDEEDTIEDDKADRGWGSMAVFSSPLIADPRSSRALPNSNEVNDVTIIDESGTLIVRLYDLLAGYQAKARFQRADSAEIRGGVVAQFQVSSTLMTQSSTIFETAYDTNEWRERELTTRYVDFEWSNAGSFEIVLGAIHEHYTEDMFSVSIARAEHVWSILRAINTPPTKLRFWFWKWLASKDIPRLDQDDKDSLFRLCHRFCHAYGAVLVHEIRTHGHIAKPALQYSPVPTPSLHQHSEMILLGRYVKPSKYASCGYSERFKQRYGEPMEYWSDFYFFMTTNDKSHLLPKIKHMDTAWSKLFATRFVEFASSVDSKITYMNGTENTVWREDMEGAWVQNAFRLYENELKRWGDAISSDLKVREVLQDQLKKIISRRFHPITRVEKYWAKKGEGESEDLWKKKTAVKEHPADMEVAVPEMGEENIDMQGLLGLMETLQVTAASNQSDPQDLTAKEAMHEAKKRFDGQ